MNTLTRSASDPNKVFVPGWIQVGSPQDLKKAEIIMDLWDKEQEKTLEKAPAVYPPTAQKE